MKDLTVKYFVNVGQVKFPSPQLDSNSAGDLDYFFVSCFPHAEHSFTSLLLKCSEYGLLHIQSY